MRDPINIHHRQNENVAANHTTDSARESSGEPCNPYEAEALKAFWEKHGSHVTETSRLTVLRALWADHLAGIRLEAKRAMYRQAAA